MFILLVAIFLHSINSLTPITGGPDGLWEVFNMGFGVEYCRIPKTGSTITIRILCDILQDYKGVPHSTKVGQLVTYENECKDHNNYFDRFITKWNRPLFETVKFTIVREPIERFVSIYGYLCVHPMEKWCPETVQNIHQFARWLYKLQKKYSNTLIPQSIREKHVLFHSWAQTGFCEIKKKNIILVHHSKNRKKMYKEMMRVLQKAHVPEKVAAKNLRHLLQSTTINAAQSRASKRQLERSVRQSPQTMKYVRAMYHEDFRYFKENPF